MAEGGEIPHRRTTTVRSSRSHRWLPDGAAAASGAARDHGRMRIAGAFEFCQNTPVGHNNTAMPQEIVALPITPQERFKLVAEECLQRKAPSHTVALSRHTVPRLKHSMCPAVR